MKKTRKIATAIAVAKKLTKRIQSDDQLIAIVNAWADKHGLVFCYGIGQPIETGFSLKDGGFDFSWAHFPGYKTVWVDHTSGVSAKFAINSNIKEPLLSID